MNGFLSMRISFYCYVLQIEVRRYGGGVEMGVRVRVRVCDVYSALHSLNLNALQIISLFHIEDNMKILLQL